MASAASLSGSGIASLPRAAIRGRPTELDLSHNMLGAVPSLPDSVAVLRLAHNRVTSIERVAALPRLRELDLSGNRIVLLEPLARATSLRVLWLRETFVSGAQLRRIPPSCPVELLDASSASVSGAELPLPRAADAAARLRTVVLCHNQLEGIGRALRAASGVQFALLDGNSINLAGSNGSAGRASAAAGSPERRRSASRSPAARRGTTGAARGSPSSGSPGRSRAGSRGADEEGSLEGQGGRDSPPGLALRALSLRDNAVASLRAIDVSRFPRLAAVDLDRNRLRSLADLSGLDACAHVSARMNRIETLPEAAEAAAAARFRGDQRRSPSRSPPLVLPLLRSLRLDGNAIASLAPLAGCHALRVLKLCHNAIAALPAPAEMAPLARSLRVLHLSGNVLTLRGASDVASLASLTRLVSLRLDRNRMRSPRPLAAAVASLACLVELDSRANPFTRDMYPADDLGLEQVPAGAAGAAAGEAGEAGGSVEALRASASLGASHRARELGSRLLTVAGPVTAPYGEYESAVAAGGGGADGLDGVGQALLAIMRSGSGGPATAERRSALMPMARGNAAAEAEAALLPAPGCLAPSASLAPSVAALSDPWSRLADVDAESSSGASDGSDPAAALLERAIRASKRFPTEQADLVPSPGLGDEPTLGPT
ncbi:hypothetical protein FNF29_07352 [Cafeteria roenbergensis]|uniref:Protein phosphatase 1 regulatory subunit 7 n=1 Tax=Cafeteria roenbergensis TaxID=33653 RepID=A0A5A8C383_CAFRO|nr:hypothetical protein FNF29_07352 [Cafeteria roenbergensis]|eukprot:KAA0147506.1 hypothetical protein FNF29_07352 [Cafeteria roenbergensis]